MIYFNGNLSNLLLQVSLLSNSNDIAFDESDLSKVEMWKDNAYSTVWTKDDKLLRLTYYDKNNDIIISDFFAEQFNYGGNNTSLCIAYKIASGTIYMNSTLSSILNGNINNLIALEDKTNKITTLVPTDSDSRINLKSKNLKYVSIPNLTVLSRYTFTGCTNLSSIDIPNVKVLDGSPLHFANTALSSIDIDNSSLVSITDGFTDYRNIIVDKNGYVKKNATLKALVPFVKKISCDEITKLGTDIFQTVSNTCTELHLKNLSSVSTASFNQSGKVSKLIVDNDVYSSVDDGYGNRTLLVTSDKKTYVNSTSYSNRISCDTVTNIINEEALRDRNYSSIVFNKDVFKHYGTQTKPGILVTSNNDKTLVFIAKSEQYVQYLNALSNDIQVLCGSVFAGTELQNVDLPNVLTVGTWEFYSSKALCINLPNCVTCFGENNFRTLSYNTGPGIKYLNLSSLVNTQSQMFYACRLHDAVSFPILTNVKTAAYQCFYGIELCNLTAGKFIQPENNMPKVEYIGKQCFSKTSCISSLTMPSVITIDQNAFQQCNNAKFFDFQNCTSVSQGAFSNCINLLSCYLPKCTSFGNGIFNYCTLLEYLDASSMTKVQMSQISAKIGLNTKCKIKCQDGEI